MSIFYGLFNVEWELRLMIFLLIFLVFVVISCREFVMKLGECVIFFSSGIVCGVVWYKCLEFF